MRFCCVAAVLTTVCVLAGCLVARAAPRKGGAGEGVDPWWKRNFSPQSPEESDGDFNTNGLVQRILNRLEQRLFGSDLSEAESWGDNQGQQLELERYRPADEEDGFIDAKEVPDDTPLTKRKCLGRFQPYALNC
ncbi:uncharacterized protein LOC110991056 [Acanthaster planci]|uniref:Uncharacterized protein LOC110991056 n=1 Tax=Acanthaster planci TaxID=133434 RepID=A0A8B8A294_ACAPL|nr:uncharacterized protein LOC110991056 [Acanthaster planci]